MYFSKLLILVSPWNKSKDFVLFTDEFQTSKTINIPINMGNKQLYFNSISPITYLKITTTLNLFKCSNYHKIEVEIYLSNAWKS